MSLGTKSVLAFDPGETTGVVSLSVTNGNVIEVDWSEELTFPEELYKFLWRQFIWLNVGLSRTKNRLYEAIVIEKFILYSHKAKAKSWSAFPEVRAQGAIEFVAWCAQIPVVPQTASAAKQMVSDQLLKDLKIWKSLTTHERDAARHAICYFLKTGVITSLKGR